MKGRLPRENLFLGHVEGGEVGKRGCSVCVYLMDSYSGL